VLLPVVLVSLVMLNTREKGYEAKCTHWKKTLSTKGLIHLYIASNFLCIPIACNLLFSKVTHTKNDCTKKGYHKIIGNLTSKEHKQNNDQKKKSNTLNNGL
jgi:hypothetical protein